MWSGLRFPPRFKVFRAWGLGFVGFFGLRFRVFRVFRAFLGLGFGIFTAFRV